MGSTSESIILLKNKFNAIKRNISIIEQTQHRIFTKEYLADLPESDLQGYAPAYKLLRPHPYQSPGHTASHPQRSTSSSYYPKVRPLDPPIEQDQRKQLRIENSRLLQRYNEQQKRMDALIKENKELKKQVRMQSTPRSCIKQRKVAFSEDIQGIAPEISLRTPDLGYARHSSGLFVSPIRGTVEH